MPLDVVVVMDPIGSIKIAKDSTFAMLLEAQRRGHRLLLRAARAACRCATARPGPRSRRCEVRDDPADWFELGDCVTACRWARATWC